MEIKAIKERLGIGTVLQHYGIEVNKNNHCLCPFHGDEKASMQVYFETNTYDCFGCDKTGDVIQFIQDIEALSGQAITKHHAAMKAKALIAQPQLAQV